MLTEIELQRLIEDVEKRFDGPDMLFEVIEKREKMFFRHPEMNPKLSPPFVSSYQTDIPRRKHQELKARLIEKEPVIHAYAYPDTQKNRDKSNKVEQVFNTGLDILQKRQGLNLPGALADGQIIHCYGVLHWLKADHLWPEVPENEWQEGPAESEEYEEAILPLGDQAEAALMNRLTPGGLLKKRASDVARAGFPWYIEVPHPGTFMWVEDRSLANGLAWGILRREVGLLDYISRAMDTSGKPKLSMHDADSSIPVYGEKDAPPAWAPSASEWGERVTLYCVWGRDDYYEVLCGADKKSQFEIVKKGSHPYEMPPFAIAPAQEINVREPAYRYLPALAGVFAIKPHYDRHMAIQLVLAEQNALPFYYMKSKGTGEPLLAEDGTTLVMERNAAFSQKLPDGYEIVAVGPEMLNPAFISMADWWRQEMQDAVPPTGQAEFTSTAQPWTVRLQQTQANVEPGLLLGNIARAMETMVQNMAMVHSKSGDDGGFGEPVATFQKMKNGQIDRSKTISVDEKDFDSIDIGVDINKVSGAEQVSKEQHGMEMLGNGIITKDDFYENYMGMPDPTTYQVKLDAEGLFEQFVKPGLGQMAQARWGSVISLGPNGVFVNGMGQQVDSQTVMMLFGQQQPGNPAQAGGATGGMNTQMGGQMQSQMPNLPSLSPDGSMPMGGLPG